MSHKETQSLQEALESKTFHFFQILQKGPVELDFQRLRLALKNLHMTLILQK